MSGFSTRKKAGPQNPAPQATFPLRPSSQAGLLPAAVFEWTGSEPFALTSFALSLLLVFRTNASYSRCEWLSPAPPARTALGHRPHATCPAPYSASTLAALRQAQVARRTQELGDGRQPQSRPDAAGEAGRRVCQAGREGWRVEEACPAPADRS